MRQLLRAYLCLLASAMLLACGAGDMWAANQFKTGGITSATTGHRIHRHCLATSGYPVAVGTGGYWGNQYFGNSGFSNLYNQGRIPVPPYFSLHPPVYYSAPVPRTYGYSPFPYSGNVRTPELISEPQEIINPYVNPEKGPAEPAQEASNKTAASAVQVIRNPFVEQTRPVKLTAQR